MRVKPMEASELNFLVVEDDDFQRRIVVNMLRSLGVREADKGKRALEMLHAADTNPVDIEICDLDMPEMDGMEFLRHLGCEIVQPRLSYFSALEEVLLVSVKKMAQTCGIKLLGVIKKPITLAQLKVLIFQYKRSEDKLQKPAVAASCCSLEEILLGVRLSKK